MNKRLFVAGLPFSSTQDDLKSLFSGVGSVVSAAIINDRETGRSKGFGFVEMETLEEADAAIKKFNGSDFGGRKLIVAEAKPMEQKSGRSERRGGFGGGKNDFGKRENFGRREGGRGKFGRDARGGGHRPGRGRFSR